MARLYASGGHKVFVTGRWKHEGLDERLNFIPFEINHSTTYSDIELSSEYLIQKEAPRLDLFVYAAGFNQKAWMIDLSVSDIRMMLGVGLHAPAIMINQILTKQDRIPEIIFITSSAQYTPRGEEPVYAAVKAGLGMLANSLSLDPSSGKIMVAAPSGMRTPFWKKPGNEQADFLDPKWVAQQIVAQSSGEYKYKFLKILRAPPHVEVVEQR